MKSQRYGMFVSIITATTLWAGGAAIAQQQPGGSNGTQTSPGQQTMPGQSTNPNAPGAGVPGAGLEPTTPQPSMVDQSFVHKAMEDSVAEVEMGKLAEQKSPSADVKQFGEKMAQIHQQLNEQMKPVADRLGVSAPKNPSKKDKQEIAKMQTLSGPEFDTAFIQAMMKDQKSDVKDFKDEAQGAQDPTVLHLAKLDEPVLSQHLQILEELAQAHNVSVESKK